MQKTYTPDTALGDLGEDAMITQAMKQRILELQVMIEEQVTKFKEFWSFKGWVEQCLQRSTWAPAISSPTHHILLW